MRKHLFELGAVGLAAWWCLLGAAAVGSHPANRERVRTAAGSSEQRQAARADDTHYGRLPLAFEPNEGQARTPVKFVARGAGYVLLIGPGEIQLALRGRSLDKRTMPDAAVLGLGRLEASTVRIALRGAKPRAEFAATEELPGKTNYLLGKDRHRWHTNIPTYQKVTERGVYPGIDLVCYGNQRQLEYDFALAGGADPSAIRLTIEGARRLRTDSRGNLIMSVPGGDLILEKPVAYQRTGNAKQLVASNYVLNDSRTVSFALGPYDRSRALVIDPILSYSTYLGGSNIDGANAIAVASDGTTFVTGGTFSLDFPVVHPLQPNHGGPDDVYRDAFVTKISADGSSILYSTYLGGSLEDVGNGIAVDAFGDAYVVGTTESGDFPVPSNTPSFNPLCGGDGKCGATWNPSGLIVSNAFVAKLNPEGTELLYSGFLGEYNYVRGYGIAVDSNQLAFVTGSVGPDIPPTVPIAPPKLPPPPFISLGASVGPQGTPQGGPTDAFVARISATGSTVQYLTYLGGTDEDLGYGVAVDSADNAYVAGLTYSTNFPILNGVQAAYGGAGDAFFAKLDTDVSGSASLLYSTYLGGNNLDQGNGVSVDSAGLAYVTGFVGAGTLPFTTASICGNGVTTGPCGGTADAFAAKIDATKVGSGSLVYFTYLGGSGADAGNGIAVDSAGNVYIAGSTVPAASAGSAGDFPIISGAFQPKYGGGNADAFISALDSTGTSLIYSSYLGGTNTDIAYGIAVDPTLPSSAPSYVPAYLAGQTCSLDFPLANPVQATPGGNCDAFISKVEILDGLELNPAGLLFNGQSLGTTSQSQTVTITDGDVSQTIAAITTTGANPGDFSVQPTGETPCPLAGGALTPGQLCTLAVSFNPQSSGIRKAQINVPCSTCGTSGIAYVLNLTGTTSTLTLSASNLAFGSQHVGVTSSPVALTATNSGTVPITFANITASGDFAETDDCTKAALQPTTNCAINITYTPSTAGSSVGALTLTDNAPGSPQVVLLTGTGVGAQSDFSLAIQPPSATIAAGHSAQFQLTVTSFGGFSGPVTLTCSGLPKSASCSGSANPVTPTSTGATVMVQIATGARTFVPANRPGRFRSPTTLHITGLLWTLLLLCFITSAFLICRRPKLALRTAVLLGMNAALFASACGGGDPTGSVPGTPAGMYQISIIGTSGTLQHTTTVTLEVN